MNLSHKYLRPVVKQNILIVGLSGNGKKSLGNSILEKVKFDVESWSTIPIKEAREKRVIIIPYNTENIIHKIEAILRTSDDTNGIDAIVFVLKYGVRFTKQEKDAVENTKKLFGDNVFRDHVILAFSYGDNFEVDHQESKLTFQEWCQEQKGEMQILFKEVNYRCVLFNNITTDKIAKKTQVDNLMSLICKAKNYESLQASKYNYEVPSCNLDDKGTEEPQECCGDAKPAQFDIGVKTSSGENDLSFLDCANEPINKKYTYSDFKNALNRRKHCHVF